MCISCIPAAACHEFPSADVAVNFTTSQIIKVTEGGENVSLSVEAFGCYAFPISIDVFCGGCCIDGVPVGTYADSTL